MSNAPPVGALLRGWRRRRRLSQLALAVDAEISQRHLSFIESGRASPSRNMLLRLAERLGVPLRERNALLVAAGFAPVYGERRLQDPDAAAARRVVETILKGHEPYPALAVDRHWTLVTANAPAMRLMAGVEPGLLNAPINVLRVSLHPGGIASRIVNFHEWRSHVLDRLAQQAHASADDVLDQLLEELKRYPAPAGATRRAAAELGGLAVPLLLQTDAGVLSFISTTTVFGTPTDVTLSELAIESFFPADDATTAAMWQLAAVGNSEKNRG
jgi:transcriptional regulator with XRE-family HTH domain